jgi:hypothetical protein
MIDLGAERQRRRFDEEVGHMTVRDLIRLNRQEHRDRHAHALDVAYVVRKALNHLGETDVLVFDQLAMLHEIGGVAIPTKTWVRVSRAECLRLSAAVLDQVGQPGHGGLMLLLSVGEDELDGLETAFQVLHLAIRRADLIREHGAAGADMLLARNRYPSAVVDAIRIACADAYVM